MVLLKEVLFTDHADGKENIQTTEPEVTTSHMFHPDCYNSTQNNTNTMYTQPKPLDNMSRAFSGGRAHTMRLCVWSSA